MTELKPDLGRFGVWTFGAPAPEQAVEIQQGGARRRGEALGHRGLHEPRLHAHGAQARRLNSLTGELLGRLGHRRLGLNRALL